MDQKSQLKSEFFELSRILNRSNLKTNQKTEISFFIEKTKYNSILYAKTNDISKLRLAIKDEKSPWRACKYSKQYLLENTIAHLLNESQIDLIEGIVLTKLIKSFIFQNFDQL